MTTNYGGYRQIEPKIGCMLSECSATEPLNLLETRLLTNFLVGQPIHLTAGMDADRNK